MPTELDESLDFSYFGGEKPVNVTYSVTSETGVPYQINIDDGEQERNSEAQSDGIRLTTTGSYSAIKYKTVLRKMATVEGIFYSLIQDGSSFVREISIELAKGTDPVVLEAISDYYTVKGAPNTEITVENESTPAVKIVIA